MTFKVWQGLKWQRSVVNFFAVTVIPLSSPDGWQNLKFSKIKPNQVKFSSEGLKIEVNESASPLIFALKNVAKQVTRIEAVLEIMGQLQMPKDKEEFPDDFYFRYGLVVPGKRTLNGFERLVAASWITELFKLAPSGSGVKGIEFYNLGESSILLGKQRITPGSKDLISEKIVAQRSPENPSLFAFDLTTPVDVAAIWISSDGDNSRSKFSVLIKSLKISEQESH